MKLIVAVARDWAIGREGGMLFHLPGDLKYFRSVTLGKAVVMGRSTLESFPGGKPLPKRRNIVLSRDPSYFCEGAEVVHSLEEARAAVSGLSGDDIFIIGGQTVYEAFLPECDTAYITKIDSSAPADRFFPNLDELPEWEAVHADPPAEENGVYYQWITYRRKV